MVAIIIHQADVFDYDIVAQPLAIHVTQAVIKGEDLVEFVKLLGTKAFFGYCMTLPVIKLVKFLGKMRDHP